MISHDLPVMKSDDRAGQKTWNAESTHSFMYSFMHSFIHSPNLWDRLDSLMVSLSSLSAFNNIFSNLGYVLLGFLFLLIVLHRDILHRRALEAKDRFAMVRRGWVNQMWELGRVMFHTVSAKGRDIWLDRVVVGSVKSLGFQILWLYHQLVSFH